MIEEITALRKINQEQGVLIKRLQDELALLKRQIFGKKTERFVPIPGQLVIEGMEQEEQEKTIPPVNKNVAEDKEQEKGKPVRKTIDESKFEVIAEDLNPEGDLENMKLIGIVETVWHDMKEAKVVLRKIKRYKYKNLLTGEIIIADLPYRPFDKSTLSASIITETIVQKYVDAMPINRQLMAWNRLGFNIPYSTLSGTQKAGYEKILPLYQAFTKDLLKTNYLMCDESPFKVLQSEKKGKSHLGYHWVYQDPIRSVVLYNYQPGRSQAHPSNMLEAFSGTIQTDGYAGYNKVGKRPNVNVIYCMAHARRYFERALDSDPEKAGYFLQEIKLLYDIERKIQNEGWINGTKMAFREEHAKPILDRVYNEIIRQIDVIPPRSTLGVALNYSRTRWQGLSAYASSSVFNIDNNPIERSIRPMVVGRNNYMFSASHESAQVAACFYSFFVTCRLHKINPKEWLLDVFNKIDHLKPSDYHTLYPQNWVKN